MEKNISKVSITADKKVSSSKGKEKKIPDFSALPHAEKAAMSSLHEASEKHGQILFPNTSRNSLVRRDLLYFEQTLCDTLERFFSFSGHALYFPRKDELKQPVFIEEEQKLLLPLRRDGLLLAVLLLRDVQISFFSVALLESLTSLCLDNIALLKASELDPSTGFVRPHIFLHRLEREVRAIGSFFNAGLGRDSGQNSREYWQSSVGVILLAVQGLEKMRMQSGHVLAEEVIRRMAAKIREVLPEEALCGRFADELIVLLPGAARRLTDAIAAEWSRLSLSLPNTLSNTLSGTAPNSSPNSSPNSVSDAVRKNTSFKAQLSVGYAIYPQDWDGSAESRDPEEIPHILIRKARIAAGRLKNQPGSLGFDQILRQGGHIGQLLPLSCLTVDLGWETGAREGMRFSVWNNQDCRQDYRGEIILMDVGQKMSQAEILLLGDPASPMQEGDSLQLLDGIQAQTSPSSRESGNGLYNYRDFMARISICQHAPYALLLLRFDRAESLAKSLAGNLAENSAESLAGNSAEDLAGNSANNLTMNSAKNLTGSPAEISEKNPAEDLAKNSAKNPAKNLAENLTENSAEDFTEDFHPFHGEDVLCIMRDEILKAAPDTDPDSLLTGVLSSNSILLYHPDIEEEKASAIYNAVSDALQKELGISLAVGIACYPFLNYRPADIWDCCRKALDYAMLLPYPHVGVFDTLAINISADRKYSMGDIFGAVEEYRTALLADEDNTLAWNSLGVCLASLGRHTEARNAFLEAFERSPDAATCYNLGTACAALGERDEARRYFMACLDRDSKHIFALVRLGELEESRKDYAAAGSHYEQAQKIAPDSSLPCRCLARLSLAQSQKGQAREYLQMALQRNSQDAVSLQMLAQLYLDGGEDACLAENLARQSVALNPGRLASWLELARALDAQGRTAEANEVRRNSVRI